MKKFLSLCMIVLLTTMAAQAATKYQINVGGVEVTSDNANNVRGGDIQSGTVTYDVWSNTLTLTNVTISRTGGDDYAVHNRDCSGLTIEFVGTCNLTTVKSHTIHLDKTTHLSVYGASSVVNVKMTQATSSNTAAIYSKNNSDVYLEGPGRINVESIGNSSSYPCGFKGEGSNPYLVFKNDIRTNIRSDGYSLYNYVLYVNSGSDIYLKSPYSGYNVFYNIGALYLYGDEAICEPADAYLSNGTLYNGGSSLYISDNYGVILSTTNFPDANFRSYMRSLHDRDYLTKTELQNLTSLNVSNKGISSMAGVEKFTYLQELRCYSNSITSFSPSSSMSRLTYLDCDGNGMTYLNLSNCPKLTYLDCGPNSLTSIYGLPSTMQTLYCNGNKFTGLSVTGYSSLTYLNCSSNTSMTELRCYANALTTLNVTGNTALKTLSCDNNSSLSTITGLTDCTAIEYLTCDNCSITDLSFANSLSNLIELRCVGNKLTSLTVNNKSKLTLLNCAANNNLTTLSVTNNSALKTLNARQCSALSTLNCYNNALTDLDVYLNTALTTLKCYYNYNLQSIKYLNTCTAITYLDAEDCDLTDLSACNSMTNLATLYCNKNNLSSLTLTGKSKLTYVNAARNPSMTTANIYNNSTLATFYINDCPALTTLNCYSNALTSLSLSGNTALTTLKCYSNKLTTLDASSLTKLATLYCYNNALTSLKVSGCTALTDLRCFSNTSLATITGLTNCTAMKKLYCYSCALTDLSAVNSMTNLDYLSCHSNKLTSLSLTNKSKLTTVECYSNPNLTAAYIYGNSALTSLSIFSCPALTKLYCNNNKLPSLSLSGNTAMTYLECSSNQLTSLDVSALTNLTTLACNHNQLTALNVDNNTKLQDFYCNNNKLTSLTVTSKSKLTEVNASNNPNMTTLTVANNSALKVLDTKNCTALTTANCYNNALTSLTVTGNTAMKTLYCYGNQLTSLDVSNCNALSTLYCYKNKISGTDMTTLVNSLPTRSTSARGILRAVYNSGESNSMTTAQITTARNKYWTPYKYTGSGWVEMTGIEDRIWMDNVEGDPGVYVNVPVTLQNSETVSAIEFDVYYPTGFSALASKGARLTDGSTVTNSTTSGYRHVAITNMNTDVIVQEAGSGIICYVRVKAPATASSGQYELGLRNINLVLASGSKTLSNCSATFTVRGKVGDVNNDGEVNITDVNCIIGVILGKPDTYGGRADVNHDDEVNITDVNAVINIILGH